MSRCRHDFEDGQCSICHVQRPPGVEEWVHTTSGGLAYHAGPDCPSMEAGQEQVHERGGTPAEIRRVSYDTAAAEGRRPCRTCYGL